MHTVAFDLDDTLYQRSQPLKKTFHHFFSEQNINFKQFHKLFKINSNIAFDKVKEGNYTLEQSHVFRVKETLKQLNVNINKEVARHFQKKYRINQQQIELSPFILEMIQFLQKKEIQTIIITNGPRHHQRNKVNNLGLNDYFNPEEIIVSGEEGVAKPNEQIFKLAENRFSLKKDNTWYVGDDYANDIIGASNVGWHSIWLNTESIERGENIATKIVTSTSQLKQLMHELFH